MAASVVAAGASVVAIASVTAGAAVTGCTASVAGAAVCVACVPPQAESSMLARMITVKSKVILLISSLLYVLLVCSRPSLAPPLPLAGEFTDFLLKCKRIDENPKKCKRKRGKSLFT
jgi:hypothetical protein